jgi:hypothetical protein
MIVFKADGTISWYRIDMPRNIEDNPDDKIVFEKSKKDSKIVEDKRYHFSENLGISDQEPIPAQYAYYSTKFSKMIIGTKNGVLAVLPIQAEKFDDGDDAAEEDEGNEKQ